MKQPPNTIPFSIEEAKKPGTKFCYRNEQQCAVAIMDGPSNGASCIVSMRNNPLYGFPLLHRDNGTPHSCDGDNMCDLFILREPEYVPHTLASITPLIPLVIQNADGEIGTITNAYAHHIQSVHGCETYQELLDGYKTRDGKPCGQLKD